MIKKLGAEITCLALITAILGGVIFAGFYQSDNFQGLAASTLQRFSSFEQLKNFVESGKQSYQSYQEEAFGLSASPALLPRSSNLLSSGQKESYASTSVPDYSKTNIQVEGVDEIDFVKTDGEYLYVVSGNDVFIVKAYPAEEAEMVSKISLNGTVTGLYIAEDRLVVVEGGSTDYYIETLKTYSFKQQASVKVFDVSDKPHPVLGPDVTVDGSYFDSRMIGDYVYAIVNQGVYSYAENEIVLPAICLNNVSVKVPATNIYYSNISDSSYTYTMIVAVNVQDFLHKPVNQTFLFGSAHQMYMSLNNVYLAYWDWGYFNDNTQKTTIHRIHIEEDSIEYVASGSVPGYVLNQFSMDEYDGYFRIATTSTSASRFSGWASQNNVYVLGMDMKLVGALESLASGETIYSARFVGKRGYLVTFKKVDPLFVIDLSNPFNPSVLGYLKITGYSNYMHPYDENHIIGIGKETVAAEEGDFAWYQGVKISLFDVTDVEHPKEISKFEIGDRGTDSPVLNDHKALLFDKARDLLVLPVAVAEIDPSKYGGEVPPYAYGETVWQGAYVFNVTLTEGLKLEGKITHLENEFYNSSLYVKRALYIDNTLFTVSDKMIKMNNLETLEEISKIQLP